jgi:hypothetical protein
MLEKPQGVCIRHVLDEQTASEQVMLRAPL